MNELGNAAPLEERRYGARPFDTEWARSTVHQCDAADVACFVKQLGSHVVHCGERIKLADHHGGEQDEWPESIPRDRHWPRSAL